MDQDQGPGAVTASAVSDPLGSLLPPGEVEPSGPDMRRGTGEVSGTRTAAKGSHLQPLKEVRSRAGEGTRREDASRVDERGSQQQARRGPLNHPRRCKSSAEEGRGPTSLWRGKHRARRGATTPKKGRVGAKSNRNTPRARGGDPQSGPLEEIRERGPLLSRQPGSGRGENEIALGESAAAGKTKGGGR